MDTSNYLFPMYEEGSSTACFFVDPAVVPPAIVSFGAGDRYGRKGHFTQYLAVPLDVPNYLALCQEPGQTPWSIREEIRPSSLQVLSLVLSLKVNGVERYFLLNTETFVDAGFVRAQDSQSIVNLNMRVMNIGGFAVEDPRTQEKTGEDIFADFLAAGYEPMLKVTLVGSFDRQRNNLRLNSVGGTVRALRNIENNDAIFETTATQEQMDLMASVKELRVVGVRMHQLLTDPAELPAAIVDSFKATGNPSPLATKFEEIIKGSGWWTEVIAEYKPYDSFDVELNVPKAMMGNPDVYVSGCVTLNFEGYQAGIATYKAAYPGMEPKRYQAFVLTPELHLAPHYPITSINDFELTRSDDERYFTSLVDMINCYTHCTENRITVMSIENQEFGCRTAQEMIDYFKQFDVSGSTYKSELFPRPTPTSDSK